MQRSRRQTPLPWNTFCLLSVGMLSSDCEQAQKKEWMVCVAQFSEWIGLCFCHSVSPSPPPALPLLSPSKCIKHPLLMDVNTQNWSNFMINVWQSTANSVPFDSESKHLVLLSKVSLYANVKSLGPFEWSVVCIRHILINYIHCNVTLWYFSKHIDLQWSIT